MNVDILKQAEEAFLQRFPGGFDNPELAAMRDRKHKPDKMFQLTQESFAKRNFKLPELIVQNMTKVITRSSIVSVFEKAKFRNQAHLMDPEEMYLLSHGLGELLHGQQQAGFEMMFDVLKSRKLAKWTLMTVCQTYYHPQRDVFVKPTTVKRVIEYFELDHLHYRPTPSWAFYDSYRAAFLDMKSRVHPSLALNNPAFSGFLFLSIQGNVL